MSEVSPLYTNNTLDKRTGITTVVAATTIVKSISNVILAANAGLEIYEDIAAMTKSESDQNSCSLVYGTDSDGTYVEGYAYEATTSGENCDTTAKKKTIIAAVKCAKKLNT